MFKFIIKLFIIKGLLITNLLAVVNSDILTLYEIEDYLIQKIQQQQKIDNIKYKLATEFIDYCPNKKKDLGFKIVSKKDINKQFTALGGTGLFNKIKKNNYKAYSNIAGDILNNQTRILYVIKKSDAFNKNIKKGDEIISINGKKNKSLDQIMNSNNSSITLKLLRGNEIKEVKIKITDICDFNINIITTIQKEISFFRSNNNLFITDGLLDYIKNDNELVLLISNEFYHYVNNHKSVQVDLMNISKKTSGVGSKLLTQSAFGLWFSAINFSANLLHKVKFKYSKNKEDAADFASIQITKLLNYDPYLAKNFWERYVKEKPPLSYISNFRDVDSQKIRTTNYSLDYNSNEFPTKKIYNDFINKLKN